MRAVPWLAAALLVALPPFASSAQILMLTPYGSRSTSSLFWVLTEGLTARGHHVTLLTTSTATAITANHHQHNNNNVTLLRAPSSVFDKMDMFAMRGGEEHALRDIVLGMPEVARKLYSDPEVMAVWRRRHEYDAIIINSAINEMAFPFLLDLSVPFITFSPTGTEPLQLSYLGNMVSPAALPSVILPYHDSLTLWERLINTVTTLALRYVLRRRLMVPLTAALRETFPHLPDPYSLYPRQALNLLNRHHLLDGALPLLPNQVEVGCLTCRPAQPLPQDVKEWVEGAGEAGVIYFSLGSIQETSRLPKQHVSTLFQAFQALHPTRVLAKFTQAPSPLPPNVKVQPWLPQQDVLGHPNVKLFVTHCGKNSAGEGVYHGVPMLGLPISMDHPRTCARLQRRGEGVVLQWEELTSETLTSAIKDMLANTRYKERVEGVSERLKAQRDSGLERAVWWIEYAIQHGDTYLRFSGADLSLAQYLLLDVLCILLVAVSLVCLPAFLLMRSLYRRCLAFHASKNKADLPEPMPSTPAPVAPSFPRQHVTPVLATHASKSKAE